MSAGPFFTHGAAGLRPSVSSNPALSGFHSLQEKSEARWMYERLLAFYIRLPENKNKKFLLELCRTGTGWSRGWSCRTVEALPDLNGQMVEDWFRQVLEACLYGMRQSGETEAPPEEEMDKRFWHCTDMAAVYRLLRQGIQAEIQRLKEAKALREMRPITEAKHYIQQHYQEALRLEDVSTAVGFNATYFSTLFKKETGQNFMDYLTELRISKAKELLCGEELSVQDVAEQVGYRDLKYFSRLFKKLTGVSPSDYKKLYK